MAKEITITKKHSSRLFDSETGKSCIVKKIMDVTEDCPRANKKNRYIFLFTQSKRGRIVQIINSSKNRGYDGMRIHFFIDELESEMNVNPRDDTFGLWAKRCGLDKLTLRSLIKKYAPSA